MAQPDSQKAKDAAKRFGSSLKRLVRRVADDPLGQASTAAFASQARVKELLGLSDPARAPQPAAPVAPGQQIIPLMDITNKPTIPIANVASQPMISLTNIKRSIGRAAVPCENQDVCGGTIELALHEHSTTNSEVGEASVIDATMIEQTCECILSEEERERVVDRVHHQLKSRR